MHQDVWLNILGLTNRIIWNRGKRVQRVSFDSLVSMCLYETDLSKNGCLDFSFSYQIKNSNLPLFLFEGPLPSPQSPVPTVLIFLPVSSWNFPNQSQYLEHLFRNFRTVQVSFKHQEPVLIKNVKSKLQIQIISDLF